LSRGSSRGSAPIDANSMTADRADGAHGRGPVNLVIFDFDGVLVDTAHDMADAANAVLATYGLRPFPVEHVRGLIGGGAIGLMRRLLPDADDETTREATARFDAEYLKCYDRYTDLFPGVPQVLRAIDADGALMAVATNKVEVPTRDLLCKLGVERYFATVVGPESVAHLKPDPEALQVILGRLGVAPGRAVIVGDTSLDIIAGTRAGVMTCAVLYGYGARAEIEAAKPDFTIADIAELPGLLGKIGLGPPQQLAPR